MLFLFTIRAYRLIVPGGAKVAKWGRKGSRMMATAIAVAASIAKAVIQPNSTVLCGLHAQGFWGFQEISGKLGYFM